MATKPTSLPRWGNGGGATVVEPTSGEKDAGWVAGQKPPAPYMNWLQKLTYDWTAWLDNGLFTDIAAYAWTFTAQHILRNVDLIAPLRYDQNPVGAFKLLLEVGAAGSKRLRLYSTSNGEFVFTINAWWSQATMLWNEDLNSSHHRLLMDHNGDLFMQSTGAGATWNDAAWTYLSVLRAAQASFSGAVSALGRITSPDLALTSSPASGTALSNVLSAASFAKSWCSLFVGAGGGGSFTVIQDDGLNCTAARQGPSTIRLTFPVGGTMANTKYCVVGGVYGQGSSASNGYLLTVDNRATTHCDVKLTLGSGADVDLDLLSALNSFEVCISIFARQ